MIQGLHVQTLRPFVTLAGGAWGVNERKTYCERAVIPVVDRKLSGEKLAKIPAVQRHPSPIEN